LTCDCGEEAIPDAPDVEGSQSVFAAIPALLRAQRSIAD
jgi:hypothetical protein